MKAVQFELGGKVRKSYGVLNKTRFFSRWSLLYISAAYINRFSADWQTSTTIQSLFTAWKESIHCLSRNNLLFLRLFIQRGCVSEQCQRNSAPLPINFTWFGILVGGRHKLQEVTEAEWDFVFSVNLKAPLFLSQVMLWLCHSEMMNDLKSRLEQVLYSQLSRWELEVIRPFCKINQQVLSIYTCSIIALPAWNIYFTTHLSWFSRQMDGIEISCKFSFLSRLVIIFQLKKLGTFLV